ncbi:hypothetical protein [Nocardioides lacusdianchii]|uniref:hypothetical protein n=1 Tax=Nocardioides lacusdianchii TaxID=2783664 RepID=UPI001CCFA550|nr:hypothetical protein [Nocardioides lacusdianchii]
MPSFVPIAPVLGAFLITVGQDLDDGRDWAWALVGFGLCLAAGALMWLRESGVRTWRAASELEAGRLYVAMKDALQPVAELIAAMPAKTKRQREAEAEKVATQATGALTLLLKDVDRLRAVVYQLQDSGDMTAVAYHGRADTPSPFLKATPRGDLALKMVSDGKDWFEKDTSAATNQAYAGSGAGYQTYISAAIRSDTDGFGMVTVDAPNPGDLVETDRQIVLLVADLLAIAFAEADRT